MPAPASAPKCAKLDIHRPLRRLIGLPAACNRRGISKRSFYRDNSLLPAPIQREPKLLFLEHEIDEMIDQLAAKERPQKQHPKKTAGKGAAIALSTKGQPVPAS